MICRSANSNKENHSNWSEKKIKVNLVTPNEATYYFEEKNTGKRPTDDNV